MANLDESSYQNLQAEIRGQVGIVTGYGCVAGTFRGAPWEHQVHFYDLYINSEKGWQIFLAHTVEVESPK